MSQEPKIKIVEIPTTDLIPNPRNAKQHDDAQVAKIAGSIREFGFGSPIITDGENGILAGHGRWLAAQKLGLPKVPCIEMRHLTKTQRRAYMLADNRLSEIGGGWDMEMLRIEMEELAAEDIDLNALGFGDDFMQTEKDDDSIDNEDVSIDSICQVICDCKNEEEQQEVYELLNSKGKKCRLATL